MRKTRAYPRFDENAPRSMTTDTSPGSDTRAVVMVGIPRLRVTTCTRVIRHVTYQSVGGVWSRGNLGRGLRGI